MLRLILGSWWMLLSTLLKIDNGDCVHLIHVQVLFKVLQIVSNVDTEVNVVLFWTI